jgi:RNA polymerase sigma factor (sigma-70 family)
MSRLLSSLLVRLHGSLQAPADQVPDAALLERFVRSRDAAAFELLFWRHGPMVRGVCRRVLGNAPDADDAFQAAFLVLARRAGSVGRGTALAAWLHRVALRTALNARKARSRRAAREKPLDELLHVPARPDPTCRALDDELRSLLDRELARLPEKLRLPLLLCDLEDRTHAAAAAELNCPLGTLNSRLARARAKLRARLLRRGVAPAGLAAILAPPAVSPAALPALTREPSAAAEALAARVARSMALATAAKLTGALAACGLVAVGLAFGAAAGTAEPPPAARAEPPEVLRPADRDAEPLPAGAVARVGSPRLRHAGEVTGLAYSPDGKWLASVSTDPRDATARLWDAATGKERFRVPVATRRGSTFPRVPRALGFSADSKRLLVPDAESLRAFDVADGSERLALCFAAEGVVGSGVAPDGKSFVLLRNTGRFEVLDVTTGAVRATGGYPLKGSGHLPVVFSPDGSRFVIPLGAAPTTPVFDAASGREVARVETAGRRVEQLLFLPDGKTLVGLVGGVGGESVVGRLLKPRGNVAFFDAATGRFLRDTFVDGATFTLAASPDGKHLVAGNGQKRFSQLIDVASGKEVGRLFSTPSVTTLAFSPDGKRLAGGHANYGAITVWDVPNRRYDSAAAEPAYFNGTVFTPDGRALVLPGRGRPVVDWRTGKTLHRLADAETDSWMFTYLSPDLKLYAVPTMPGPVRLLDAESGSEVRRLDGHAKVVGHAAFSPDGRQLVTSGYDKTVRVWEVASGKEAARFTPPEAFGAEAAVLSADGRVLAVNFSLKDGRGNVLYTWDVDTKAALARVEVPHRSVSGLALSPDGRLLAAGGGAGRNDGGTEDAVSVWDATSGRRIHSLPGHDAGEGFPTVSCSFSPDGRWLVTGDAAGRLRLWEMASGREVHHFDGHHAPVTANFSPDGRLLVAASDDAPSLVWDVTGHAPDGRPRTQALSPGRLEEGWTALGGDDPRKAYQSVWALASDPERSVPFLVKHVRPAAPPEPALLNRLVAGLDADAFGDREEAEARFAELGEAALPTLRKLRGERSSPEVRRRAERILERLANSPEWLRGWRAVAALEYSATPEARRALEALAGGVPEARLTAEARAALKRLTGRP